MRDAANLLAEFSDWEPLYREQVLSENSVPVIAAVYYDDMYVDLDLSTETAKKIRNCRMWITNEFQHNAIRTSGAHVLDKLLSMLKGET